MNALSQRWMSFTLLAAALSTSVACSKIADLGKRDDGGASGGLLSFLDRPFEGEITMAVTGRASGKGGPASLVYGVKSPNIRLDIQGSKSAMLGSDPVILAEPGTKKVYALLPKDKKAFLIDVEKVKSVRGMAKGLGGLGAAMDTPNPPTVDRTGKHDVVAGYGCEIIKVTSKLWRAETCLAEGIRWIDITDLGMESPELAAAAAVTDLNHFPLRIVTFDASNVEVVRMTATKIEKKSMDSAHFSVPTDYQVVDLAQMFGSLPGIASGQFPLPTPAPKRPH
jgi:hypothetical protein